MSHWALQRIQPSSWHCQCAGPTALNVVASGRLPPEERSGLMTEATALRNLGALHGIAWVVPLLGPDFVSAKNPHFRKVYSWGACNHHSKTLSPLQSTTNWKKCNPRRTTNVTKPLRFTKLHQNIFDLSLGWGVVMFTFPEWTSATMSH